MNTVSPTATAQKAPAPQVAAFPEQIAKLASGDKKVVYAHWTKFFSGAGGGKFTGVDAFGATPLGPPQGFKDADLAASYVRDVATGTLTDPLSVGGTGGIISAAIIRDGESFFPLQLTQNLVGGPGRASHHSGPDTVLLTANDQTGAWLGGQQVSMAKGEQGHSPWGYRNYAEGVTSVVVADSAGAVADVPREGRARWWNTPNSGGISLD